MLLKWSKSLLMASTLVLVIQRTGIAVIFAPPSLRVVNLSTQRAEAFMKLYILILPIILMASSATQAASFDCSKASTFVETEICETNELGRLDEILSIYYKTLINANIDRSEIVRIKSSQKKWLSSRNKCTNKECLISSYIQRNDELCGMQVSLLGQSDCKEPDNVVIPNDQEKKVFNPPSQTNHNPSATNPSQEYRGRPDPNLEWAKVEKLQQEQRQNQEKQEQRGKEEQRLRELARHAQQEEKEKQHIEEERFASIMEQEQRRRDLAYQNQQEEIEIMRVKKQAEEAERQEHEKNKVMRKMESDKKQQLVLNRRLLDLLGSEVPRAEYDVWYPLLPATRPTILTEMCQLIYESSYVFMVNNAPLQNRSEETFKLCNSIVSTKGMPSYIKVSQITQEPIIKNQFSYSISLIYKKSQGIIIYKFIMTNNSSSSNYDVSASIIPSFALWQRLTEEFKKKNASTQNSGFFSSYWKQRAFEEIEKSYSLKPVSGFLLSDVDSHLIISIITQNLPLPGEVLDVLFGNGAFSVITFWGIDIESRDALMPIQLLTRSNNQIKTIKDVFFECKVLAKSGTIIGSFEHQEFDSWSPGEIKHISFYTPYVQQASDVVCLVRP